MITYQYDNLNNDYHHHYLVKLQLQHQPQYHKQFQFI
jgi:hypothetical protein